MGQTRSCGPEGHGLFIGSVLGVFAVIFVLFAVAILPPGCSWEIDPQRTYQVFDVTDSAGKTYRNLKRLGGDVFTDYHGNQYTFKGNYTAITRRVSGEQFMKDVGVERQ